MKRIALFIIVAVTLLSGLFFLFVLPSTSQGQMKAVLRDAGFAKISVNSAAKIPGGYSFDAVSLDPNQFSTIENVTLLKAKDGKNLTLNKLVLTGDWRKDIMPEISGWLAPANIQMIADSLRKNNIDTLTLNGGQLDIVMPLAGLIRLEAKGQLNLLPDGAVRLQAVLWSVQKQLKSEIQINGEFAKNGIASLDLEIVDGRVAFDGLDANRLGGWLILNKKTENEPWSISAQMVAGTARMMGTALNGLTLSAQGNLQDATMTLQASGNDNNGTALAVDARLRAQGQDKIVATLRADHFTSLLQMLPNSTPTHAAGNRPGAILSYESEADTLPQLRDTAKISIADLSGEIWLNGNLRKTSAGFDLDIQQTSAHHLGRALGLESFAANGMLTGLVPFTLDEKNALKIEQGLLRATQPAKLFYTGDALPAALQASRKDALALLHSFTYDNLEVLVSGPVAGQIEGDISMTGKPDQGADQKATLITLHIKGRLQDE